MLEELMPVYSNLTTVRFATPIPNLLTTVGLPKAGKIDSALRLRWLTSVMQSLLDLAQFPATVSGSLAHITSIRTRWITTRGNWARLPATMVAETASIAVGGGQ